jgi:hypothetical protein
MLATTERSGDVGAPRGGFIRRDRPRAVLTAASAGYPSFLREYGLELWNHAEASPITAADVDAVREIVTDSLARNFGARDQRGVSVHRESLIGKGLIWSPRRGQLDLTVPLFAEFLRENYPIASFNEG